MSAGKFWLAVAQALTIAGIIWIVRSERATAIDLAVLREHACHCLSAPQSHATAKALNQNEN